MHFSTEHDHNFTTYNHQGEKRTFYVLLLTLSAMVAEIISGTIFGSMALLADGWHMGAHAAAFCITILAYRYARKHTHSGKFSFGAGKVSVLGGYSSAIVLGVVALIMMVESISRLFHPQTIKYNEAIMVAVIGLIVNLISMLLLRDDHEHEHEHHDHNLRAAYLHVLADTLTSVLAIVALFFGKAYGWNWLDALMGMVGALVILKWTIGLMKQTSPVLLDESIDKSYKKSIVDELLPFGSVKDMHMWKISGDHYAAAITLESKDDKTVAEYKQMLSKFDKIAHLTLEVHPTKLCTT